jgi:salicylate hydroxylase
MMVGIVAQEEPIEVAIVGGGIIGLVLALGLLRRGIKVKVYEQARSLREIGAGVAFTANAIRCMNLIDPNIVAALRSVATSNGDPNNPNDYLQWVDGYNTNEESPGEEQVLFKLYAGTRGFEGCHRAHFLDALVKFVPEGLVEFRKRLDVIQDNRNGGKVELTFCDGTTFKADAGEISIPSRP